MKKQLLQITFICISFFSLTQQADYLLQTSAYNDVNVRTIDLTSNGETIAGLDLDQNQAGICKIDGSGNLEWAKELDFAGASASCSYDIVEKANGNYYLHGLVMINGSQNAFLVEVTPNGTVVFAKEYFLSNSGVYYINSMKVADNGDLVFMGSYSYEIYVFRTDANGVFLWGKAFTNDVGMGGKNPGYDLELLEGGNIIVLGQHTNAMTLIRLDSNGNVVFSKKHAIGVSILPQDMVLVNNQDLYICGVFSTDSINPNSNLPLIKVNSTTGNIDWIKTVIGANPSAGVRQKLVEDNGVIKHTFMGLDSLQSSTDQFVIHYSLNGIVTSSWRGNDTSAGTDYNSLDIINGFDHYYGGLSVSSGSGNAGWIYEPDGGVNCYLEWYPLFSQNFTDFQNIPANLIETPINTGNGISLTLIDISMGIQSYCELLSTSNKELDDVIISPNPSNGMINISNLTEAAFIQVYDVSGKRIHVEATILSEISIDLGSANCGIYIVKIQSDSHQITRRVQKL